MVFPLYYLFWVCDAIYVPHLLWEFLLLRTSIIPAAYLAHRWIRAADTLFACQRIALFYTVALGLPITLMVAMIGDPSSPYYAGLNLVAVGMLSFIPWTARYFILGALVIYLPYYAVALYDAVHTGVYQFVLINSFFIGGTLIITAVIRYYRERLQEKDYASRAQLLEGKARLQKEIESRIQAERDALEARDEALKANHAKDVFLANMSHELRTPLNAVLGYTEMIRDDLNEHGNHSYDEDCSKIVGAGKHLLGLINTVLDMSKVAAGKMDVSYDTVNIEELIDTVVGITRPVVAKNGNELVCQIQPGIGTIRADEIKLRQCLINIIGNAAKFTQHGKVSLTVKSEQISGEDWIYFRIDDTGIGMTPEQCRKIFDPFTQASATTARNYGGTGLGLAISRSFARLMFGDIVVKSAAGVGSTFTIVLPREEGRHQQLKAQRGNRERRRTEKLALIIDDGAINVAHLETLFVANAIAFDVFGRGTQSLQDFIGNVGVPDLLIASAEFATTQAKSLGVPQIVIADSGEFDGSCPLGVHVVATRENWHQRLLGMVQPGTDNSARLLVIGSTHLAGGAGFSSLETAFTVTWWNAASQSGFPHSDSNYQWIVIDPGAVVNMMDVSEIVHGVRDSDARTLLIIDGNELDKTRLGIKKLVTVRSGETDKLLSSTTIKLFRKDASSVVDSESETDQLAEAH